MENYKEYCLREYKNLFDTYCQRGIDVADAQRTAIKEASIKAIKLFPNVEPTKIWEQIYVAHVFNKSSILDSKVIDAVISADQSWRKSSGHAFEELIKEIGNLHLKPEGIEFILQKELSHLLKNNAISNEVRDISWLKEQTNKSIFDLYLTVSKGKNKFVFGCVQSKTSIRERVKGDREPSINAMKAFFMSIAVVLDGTFLKLPKFMNMVNGQSGEYLMNGWHAMYVLTNDTSSSGRIHKMGIGMESMIEHCKKGANFWLTQRQWLDSNWDPNV